jgi:hypothetical protein
MGGLLLVLSFRGVVDCDRGGSPFFSRSASRRKSDFGSMISPPDVDGRCDGVIVARRGRTGYWFGVKYFGVVLVLDMLDVRYGDSMQRGSNILGMTPDLGLRLRQ